MKLTAQELAQISSLTLEHYNQRAEDFWQGTREHDVSQNIAALLRHLKGGGPHDILDFGCGPGRDMKTFAALGHRVVGLDGAARFTAMASAHCVGEVWQQDFVALDLPSERFDGIFANATLFHVPAQELPQVLRKLCQTLKSDGVLFASNPRGNNDEGWNGGRYGSYHDLDAWRGYMQDAGFVELEHYYRPEGMPREQQPWLASVWRKAGRSERSLWSD